MLFSKKYFRYEWALVIILIVILTKQWYERSKSSNCCTGALGDLNSKAKRQNKLVSNFLLRNELASLLSLSESNASQSRDAAKARQDFYKRCFSRPAVNESRKLGSDHPHFPGYIIENPDLCSSAGHRVDVLVYINSAVQNRKRRRAIRHSWASHGAYTGLTVRLVFILGEPASRREQMGILTEQASSGDIVQAKFEDTFRNLTLKAVTFMAWANAHCAQAQYIVKADDDMFVDMFGVISNIIPKVADKKFAMACAYTKKGVIKRDPKSNWYVEEKLLAGQSNYPAFCPGFFSVITGNMIPNLFEASISVKDFIPIDDVYMTGLSVKNPKNVSIVDIKDQLTPNGRSDPDQEIKVNGHFEYIAFRVKEEEQHKSLWDLRLNKLSDLEQSLSSYSDLINIYEKQTLVIKG